MTDGLASVQEASYLQSYFRDLERVLNVTQKRRQSDRDLSSLQIRVTATALLWVCELPADAGLGGGAGALRPSLSARGAVSQSSCRTIC